MGFCFVNCSIELHYKTVQFKMQLEIFQPELYLNPKWYFFKKTELGRVYDTLPWDQLEVCLPEEKEGTPGAPRWFSNKGMFALMFLKSYLNISDEKLIDRFNTDYSLQLFCGKLLKAEEYVGDNAIVSRIRNYISDNCDWNQVQKVLIEHWKRDMNNTHVLFMDATCYESYVRYPTDVKLLWESCKWVFEKAVFKICRLLSEKRPRSKYKEQKQKQRAYDLRKKKTYREGQKRKKALIYLLEKGLGQLQQILNSNCGFGLSAHDFVYLKTIKKVLEQQKYMFEKGINSIEDRIVSLPKPYIRPIVRGKETKRVEFGMKVHMLQVDGICFIDHISFNAYNEAKRLKVSVLKHKKLFGECYQLGADGIYANNGNRTYTTKKEIFTSFLKKGGRSTKEEDKLRLALAKERSTVTEGSFGTQKTSYGLQKIKAKKAGTEIVWMFFGVMTANAVKISKRKATTTIEQHNQAA